MPCMSYDTNWANDSSNREVRKLKAEADKLARIACKAMSALEEEGKADFLMLKDDELRAWWKKHKEDDAREQARIAEKERRERVKAEALASLSDEAKELLGLAKPKKKSSKAVVIEEDDEDVFDDDKEYADWDNEIDTEELINQLEQEYHKLTDGTVVKTFKIR